MNCRSCHIYLGMRTACPFCGSRLPMGRDPTPMEREHSGRERVYVPDHVAVSATRLNQERNAVIEARILTWMHRRKKKSAHQLSDALGLPLLCVMASLRRMADAKKVVACGMLPAVGKRKVAILYRLAATQSRLPTPARAIDSAT